MKSSHYLKLLTLLAIPVALNQSLYSASATWTGTTDGNWATGTNWSTGAAPNTAGDIATFGSSLNTNITTPGALVGVNFLFANAADTAAYTIGSLPSGAGSSTTTLTAGSGWNVTAGVALPTVNLLTTSQIFNPNVALGTRATAGSISFTNQSTALGQLLTINSNVAANNSSTGAWTVQFRGNGNKVLNGVISDAGTTGTIVSIGGGGTNTGTTTLNGANTYTGGTTMGGGVSGLVIGNKAALGTGALTLNPNGAGSTISAGIDLTGSNAVANAVTYTTGGLTIYSGSNNMEFTGAVNLNSTVTAGLTQTVQVNAGVTTTLSGIVSNTTSTALSKTGAGILILSGNNSYSGGTGVSAGTLLLNSQTGSATGTSGQITVSSTGTLGGNGNTSSIISVNAGGTLAVGGAGGNSTGILTSTSVGGSALSLAAGSFTAFDINGATKGTGYDNFTTAGRILYGGAFTATFGALAPDGTTVYDLFSSSSIGTTDFSSVTIAGSYVLNLTLTGTGATGVWSGTAGDGTSFSFSQSTGDLTVAIPEPSTYAALLGGAGLLVALVRRRRARLVA